MDYFEYKNGELYAEDVPLSKIAQSVGTPCYVYSRATLERHWHAFNDSFGDHPHLVCYAVKANSNLAVLNVLARMGSGFDIVSGGELYRVIRAGGDPAKVVFSGVGKTRDEIAMALEYGIHCFNVESQEELLRINEVAGERKQQAPIAVRVNPDVDAKTHPYISTGLKENKFGIDINLAQQVYEQAQSLEHVRIVGVACHIGSQLTELRPFMDALDRVLLLVDTLAKKAIVLSHIDLGGGLGVRYKDEEPPLPQAYAKAVSEKLAARNLEVHIEPGRAIAANAGVLITRVEYTKHSAHKNFAIVDAAMNDLIRPSLYDSWQNIIPLVQSDKPGQQFDVVGPVCETGDFLGKDRELALSAGDMLAVRSAGAYGFTMSSNYNSRPRVPEVMVHGSDFHVVRKRETLDDLIHGESILKE